jgi:hypothetical protein
MDDDPVKGLKKKMDEVHAEYMRANRWLWSSGGGGVAYASFCEWNSGREYPNLAGLESLVLLTKPGILLLGGLSLIGVLIFSLVRRDHWREYCLLNRAWLDVQRGLQK